MTRPHRLPLSTLCLPLLLLAACSDDTTRPDARPADRGGALEARGEARPPDLMPDRVSADQRASARLCGTVVDDAGTKVGGASMIVCNDHAGCLTATADSGGAFCVTAYEAGDYLCHATERTAGGTRWGDVLLPTTIAEADVTGRATLDLGTLVQPVIAKSAALDAAAGGTLTPGTGVTLKVAAGAADLGLKTSADVGYATLPASKLHPKLLATHAGSPELAFLLVPLGVSFSPAAALELTAPGAIADGTLLDLYWVNEKTGKPELQAAPAVAGGKVSATLKSLGWYLLYKK